MTSEEYIEAKLDEAGKKVFREMLRDLRSQLELQTRAAKTWSESAQAAYVVGKLPWIVGESPVDIRRGHMRYEKLRKLNPREFKDLWEKALKGSHFDSLVDKLEGLC